MTNEPSVNTASAPPKGPSRLAEMVQMTNGLNAARVLAAFMVVTLHSAIPYITAPIPTWLLLDTSRHLSMDIVVLVVNGFVMPLFFLLAGMSVAKSCAQTPFREFAWNRFCRLGSPFLLTAVLAIPVCLFVWAFALLWTERITMSQLPRLRFPDEIQRMLAGPGHLWFLEYLFLLCVGWCAIVRSAQRWSVTSKLAKGEWAHAAIGSLWRPLVCAVPTTILFAWDTETPFRLISHFIPDVMRVLHYSIFFIVGVWLASLPGSYAKLQRFSLVYLFVAVLCVIPLVPLTFTFLEQRLPMSGCLLLAALQALFSWTMVFGFLGICLRLFQARREDIRYLHEGSFWLYLGHLPIVCVLQLIAWQWPIAPWWKLLFVTSGSLLISYLSFEFLIRYSWLGAVIHGMRKEHPTVRGWRLELPWLTYMAAVAAFVIVFMTQAWEPFFGTNLHTVVEGRIYRSNRMKSEKLTEVIARHGIRSVVSLSPYQTTDPWYVAQAKVCEDCQIPLASIPFYEQQVPASQDLQQLYLALENMPRPVLIVGGKCAPTLSALGASVALMIDGEPVEIALEQFGYRYFQLDGPEHCILARPLRDYRDWLRKTNAPDSFHTFCMWNEQFHLSREAMQVARKNEPAWQYQTGAPRYPRRY